MSHAKEEFTLAEQGVLNLFKLHIEYVDKGIDTLERKAHNNFTIISIIAALVTGFNIGLDSIGYMTEPILIISFIIGILIFVVAMFSLCALRPKKQFAWPMVPRWEEVWEWMKNDKNQFISDVIYDLETIHKKNSAVLKSTGTWVSWSHVLIGVVILLLAVEVAICVFNVLQ
ncbi:MAG: hypothetical protein OXN94_05840 [Chloroflexota bacterium]|nr:hypothetical protein [Chloroflexota bacterium]